ncbi:phage tail protein [Planococcus halocryophilus]|uniref:phage tail protein n=1 Tax=Planococcus halocryophilus TaxID=1215089 RepID=UPI001F1053D1|nr:hypothetical protein [Planococcus halocryophilus]MCH4825791.1 hypothetical protein [Planococcus halocryophilus]
MSMQDLSVRISADITEFRNAMDQITDSVREAGDTVRDSMGGAENSTSGGVGRIKSALGGVAGIIAGAFAIDKIKDFGISLVESAADSQAMTAQFEQVFGGLQGEATKAIDGMGQEFGMVSSRIKPAFTQMTSLFKGLGLDSEEAMDGASRAMTASADAAAFYDVSMEDASSALTSFMKGNWEAGESIGLFANEAQMASYASDTLGQDYKSLDEAGKQLVRLSFAESMQESAGAMGQASRESGSYQNQLGNLKQIWTDLKGQLGQPILAVAIAGIKSLAGWIGKIDPQAVLGGFKAFGSYVSSVFAPIIAAVKDNFTELFGSLSFDAGSMSSGFEMIRTAVSGFGELIKTTTEGLGWFIDKFDFLILGVTAGVLTFKAITAAKAAWVTITTTWAAVTKAAAAVQAAFNLVLAANPIAIVVVAVAALVAIGILLYKNWDTVVAFLKSAWETIKSVASSVWGGLKVFFSATWNAIKQSAVAIFSGLKDAIASVWNGIKSAASAVWNGIKSFLSGLWNGIKALASAVFNALKAYFTTVFNIYKTLIMTVWNGIKSFLSTIWNGIKSLASSVFNSLKSTLTTIFNAIKSTVTSVWNAIKSFLTTTFNAIKSVSSGAWNAIKSTITTIMNSIKSTVTSIWNSVKSSIVSVFNSIKSTASSVWNSIKSTIVNTVETLKNSIVAKFNSVKSSASSIFSSIKSAMTNPVEAAKTAIGNAISKIKGFFSGLKLTFPKISMPKMPTFSLSGKFSLMPPSVPKVGISWNAKGGIFKKPTILNSSQGLQGVGEAGSEAILPLTAQVLGSIGRGIASTMQNPKSNSATVIDSGRETYNFNFNVENMNANSNADVDSFASKIQNSLRRSKGVK